LIGKSAKPGTTNTAWELDWITRGVGVFFPEQWARFRDGVPEAELTGDIVEAYHRLLMNPDSAIHEKAARDWCDWEMALVAVHPNHTPHPRYEKSAFRLAFARIITHYWRHVFSSSPFPLMRPDSAVHHSR
jgi:proline iminopeptidase